MHVVDRTADVVAVRLVGKAQTLAAIEVEDRQADAVGDDAQAMLALAGLEFEALDVVDVGIRRQDAAHVAARTAVGVVVDADPEGVALDRRQLAFEADALAGQRRLEIGVVELVEFAPVDLDHLAAEDVALGLAGPVEEGAVDEAVALLGVDVADGQAERVQLALRQRQQGFPFHPFAHGLERRVVQSCQ